MRTSILVFAFALTARAHAEIGCAYEEVERVTVTDPLTERESPEAGATTFTADGIMTKTPATGGITAYELTLTDSLGQPVTFKLRVGQTGKFFFTNHETGGGGGLEGQLDGPDFDTHVSVSFASDVNFGRRFRCHGSIE